MKKIIIPIMAVIMLLSACGQTQETEPAVITEAPTQEADLGYVMDNEDVHITKDGTTLKDMTITGDLYIDESVGEGDVTIENVTVEGTTYVLGGGKNSVHFFSYFGYTTIVRSPFDTRMTVNDVSSLGDVFFEAGGSVEYYGPDDYSPAHSVNIGGENTGDAIDVNLKGNYNNVNVNSDANVNVDGVVDDIYVDYNASANVDIAEGGQVNYIDSYGTANVSGAEGSVGSATMGAGGGSLPGGIEKIGSHEDGATVNVGGEEYTLPKTDSAQQVGEYNRDEDGGYASNPALGGFSSIVVDKSGKVPGVVTVEKADFTTKSLPATLYYSVVEYGSSAPSKAQIMGGFGAASGSKQYSQSNDGEGFTVSGFNISKRTHYYIYILVVDADGDHKKIVRRSVYVSPTEEGEGDDNSGSGESSSSGSSASGSASGTETTVMADGYPKVIIGEQTATVTVKAYQSCKVYFLMESPEILAKGTTPQDVKNGVSKGAGTTMGDGEYLVFHGVINVNAALTEYSATVGEAGGGGGDDGNGPPPDVMAQKPGVFLVIEYADGTLSQVYTYK